MIVQQKRLYNQDKTNKNNTHIVLDTYCINTLQIKRHV